MGIRFQLQARILELISTRDYSDISAVTGHRKTKLPDTDESRREKTVELSRWLIKHNSVLVNGGANGWDLETLIQAYKCKIPYVLVLPYRGRRKSLEKTINDQYTDINGNDLLEQAIDVIWALDGYHISGYHIRDDAMVLVCNTLHTYWDGRKTRSGTWNTIRFAQKVNATRLEEEKEPQIKIIYWNKFTQQQTTIDKWSG